MTTNGHESDRSFEVQIAGTGKVYTIAAGESVVSALAGHGIEIPVSCGHGLCGTCLTRVVAGVPDHRDYYLTNAEREANQSFTPCCSRSKTPLLVIDL
jgi:vanillate O-demethylase ferredoxin subunit